MSIVEVVEKFVKICLQKTMLYKEFKDREVEHMDTIRDSIETRANDVLKRDKNRESR